MAREQSRVARSFSTVQPHAAKSKLARYCNRFGVDRSTRNQCGNCLRLRAGGQFQFMIALLLCVIGALAAFFVGRRSLAAGCLVVAASGYAYGILRANLVTPVSHFIFDAALIGLYAAQFLPNSKKLDGAPPQSGLR